MNECKQTDITKEQEEKRLKDFKEIAEKLGQVSRTRTREDRWGYFHGGIYFSGQGKESGVRKMKCTKCGNEEIKEEDNFCIICGEKIKRKCKCWVLKKGQLRLWRK